MFFSLYLAFSLADMKHIILFLLFMSQFVLGQNLFEIGISYGVSSVFRAENNSHYDYKNRELGLFLEKDYAWKTDKEIQFLNKYWAIQSNMYLGDYEFKSEYKKQKTFRVNTLGGIKFEKDLGKIILNLKPMIGVGYNSGYYGRLASGIYFTEQLSIGFEKLFNKKKSLVFNIGGRHISNANVYELNRGAEIAFIQIGIRFL